MRSGALHLLHYHLQLERHHYPLALPNRIIIGYQPTKKSDSTNKPKKPLKELNNWGLNS